MGSNVCIPIHPPDRDLGSWIVDRGSGDRRSGSGPRSVGSWKWLEEQPEQRSSRVPECLEYRAVRCRDCSSGLASGNCGHCGKWQAGKCQLIRGIRHGWSRIAALFTRSPRRILFGSVVSFSSFRLKFIDKTTWTVIDRKTDESRGIHRSNKKTDERECVVCFQERRNVASVYVYVYV